MADERDELQAEVERLRTERDGWRNAAIEASVSRYCPLEEDEV
jgi:hypothetical protein